jgi:hypothetical protein
MKDKLIKSLFNDLKWLKSHTKIRRNIVFHGFIGVMAVRAYVLPLMLVNEALATWLTPYQKDYGYSREKC